LSALAAAVSAIGRDRSVLERIGRVELVVAAEESAFDVKLTGTPAGCRCR